MRETTFREVDLKKKNLEQGRQRLGVVWEEGKRIKENALSFSRPFFFSSSQSLMDQNPSIAQLINRSLKN